MTRWSGMRGIGLACLVTSALLPISAPLVSQPSASSATSTLYTPDADPLFAKPYVDIDEWRDTPVRHRYVHGGFEGTQTRFSFYFPDKAAYRGRFFQHVTPVPDSEDLAQRDPPGKNNRIAFTIASGAYFVETNGGGKFDLGSANFRQADPTISAYKANAAAAQYSRSVAQKMYGGKRPYGYVYGGSGGGYRTIGAVENTVGVWDGSVPYVIGSTMAIPNMFTARMQALRVLRDKFPQIIDAVEPGGSGNPYEGLTDIQADVLREVTGMGFPIQSWFGYKTMGVHGFSALYGGVTMADPTYFSDFWTKPGYLGFDHPERFTTDRIQYDGHIAAPVTGAEAARLRLNLDASRETNRGGVDEAFKAPTGAEATRIVGFRLKAAPPAVYFLGGDLIVKSGKAKDKRLTVARIVNDIVILGFADQGVASQIAAGDSVAVDNSNFLAMETYHRHQVPGPDFKVWDQFRKADGTPIYPQRPMLLGPSFVKATAGSLQTGKITGKMIVVESLWDREAVPWQGDWYRQRVAEHLGSQADANFRLWYTDHALHGDAEGGPEAPDRIVSYLPILQQALGDVSAWVEKGIVPPKSTAYQIDQGLVKVADTANARAGVQPVVTLGANGAKAMVANVGEDVTLSGNISVPPGAGWIVAGAWDFDGSGNFNTPVRIAKRAKSLDVKITHRFDRPGTYFVGLKGVSQRQGDKATPYAQIENIDRMRIVVR